MRHEVNFKRGRVGLNPGFSFFQTGYLNKAKEPSISSNLHITGEGKTDSCLFQRH